MLYQMHVPCGATTASGSRTCRCEQLAEIREWFEAVNDRYPEMDYVQVVNEP
jgi:GH35 family endo-1,4-beta-xylanase